MDAEHITIVDAQGNEALYEILFTFDSEDFGKSYVLVYESGTGDDDEVDVLAFSYTEQAEGEGELQDIETDEEWEMIEEVMNTFVDENEAE